MTSDADVGKLLAAVEASGSKLVAVGDFRQLGAVGPGGALEALAARHPGHVWTLTDNLRQRDPAERLALDHLRAGHVPAAVNWYVATRTGPPGPATLPTPCWRWSGLGPTTWPGAATPSSSPTTVTAVEALNRGGPGSVGETGPAVRA